MFTYWKQIGRKRNGLLSFVVAVAILFSVGIGSSRCTAADLVPWETAIPVAISKARAGGKLVLLHFYGDSCPPCRLMDRDVFSRPDVAAAVSEHYVAVKINSPDAKDLVQRLNITSIPADVVLIPDGTILTVHTGGITAGDFIQFLGREDFQTALQHYHQVTYRVPAAPMVTQSTPEPMGMASTVTTAKFRPRPEITVPISKITVAGTVGMATTRQIPLQPVSLSFSESVGFSDFDVASWAAITSTADEENEEDEVDVVVVVSEPAATIPWQEESVTWTVPSLPVSVWSEPTATIPWQEESVAQAVPPLPVSVVSEPTVTMPWQENTAAQTVSSLTTSPHDTEPEQEPCVEHAVEPTKLQPVVEKNIPNTAPVPSEELLGLVFEGYCPVELVENSRWVCGEFRLTAIKDTGVYLFSSQSAKEQFEKTPEKYIPAANGGDVVIRKNSGKTILGLRKYGVEYNGKTYLFVSQENLETFSAEPARFCENVSN